MLQRLLKDRNQQQPDEDPLRAKSWTKKILSLWGLGPGTVAHGSVLGPQSGSALCLLLLGFSGALITAGGIVSGRWAQPWGGGGAAVQVDKGLV